MRVPRSLKVSARDLQRYAQSSIKLAAASRAFYWFVHSKPVWALTLTSYPPSANALEAPWIMPSCIQCGHPSVQGVQPGVQQSSMLRWTSHKTRRRYRQSR